MPLKINNRSTFSESTNRSILSPRSLKQASVLECGNKHVTLIELYRHFEKHPLEGVNVPPPFAISHSMAEEYLRGCHSPLFKNWEKLCLLYEKAPDKENFLNSPDVDALIKSTQETIRKDFKSFPLPFDLCQWLQAKEGYFMVRSTGVEDGEVSANAGANVSCNYRNAEEIPTSIGEVIASYIDKRSLSNRIRAGENPFATQLCLPVSIQELIGECVGGGRKPC